jgi:hypothetical protein
MGLFFVLNILAGFLNYMFQVIASKELSQLEFAGLNSWFANLSLFFFFAGLLNYASIFSPAEKSRIRWVCLGTAVVAPIMTYIWMVSPQPLGGVKAMLIVGLAISFSWMMGQALTRMLYSTLAVANVSVGLCKVAVAAIPIAFLDTLSRYGFAYFASYIPAIAIYGYALLRYPFPPSEKPKKQNWMAPILLSGTTAIIPQLDLIILNQTLSSDDFAVFARASLFYKGIFFVMAIFFQWILPQQLHQKSFNFLRISAIISGVMLLGCFCVAVASPYVGGLVLHWAEVPPVSLVFLSCLNMSLLTLIYFTIQEVCAKGRVQIAAVLLGAIVLQGMAHVMIKLPAQTYLIAMIVTQLLLISFTFKKSLVPAA